MSEELPNFDEAGIENIWRYHQEHADSAAYHGERRSHAKAEILKRAAEADATALVTPAGTITITPPPGAAYEASVVEGDFLALIERDELQADWAQNVSHSYKIKKPWLNKLRKLGGDYPATIDAMTIAATGTPSLKGPSLQEMGGYAPEEEGEEVEVPTI